MHYNILICDDDKDILNALEIYLSHEDYTVFRANHGEEAVAMVQSEDIHLLLMDIMMPVMDGIAAAVAIRNFSNIPIIFLSAKSEDTDRIFGLNMGADDYITKPFNPVELMARVKAALRRYARLGGLINAAESLHTSKNEIFQTGGLVLNNTKKLVCVDDTEIMLTAIEFNILHLLISNLDRVFTSEQIYEAVWDEPAFNVSKTVSVHIRNIRGKIEINPKEPKYLKVIYGLGYKVVRLK